MKNQKGFTSIILILFILVVAGIGGWYFLNQSSFKSIIPTPTPTPSTQLPSKNDEMASWKTYIGMTSDANNGPRGHFSIKYPSHWTIEGSYLYPFEENKKIFFILGDVAKGGPIPYTKKVFPTGVADYVWIESAPSSGVIFGRAEFLIKDVSYNFGVEGLPLQYDKEYQQIFDQTLSTFKFID